MYTSTDVIKYVCLFKIYDGPDLITAQMVSFSITLSSNFNVMQSYIRTRHCLFKL